MTGPVIVDSKGAGVGAADDSKLTCLSVILVALSAISGLLFGYDTGVVSGAMLLIRPEFNLSDIWHEMIVSGTILGALVFSLVGGFCTDKFGRRMTILFASFAFTAGSLMLGFAPNKELMLVARVVVGIGVGLGSATTPTYIAESAAPRWRGVLVSCYTLGCTFGQCVASVICALLSELDDGWRWMLGIAVVPSALMLAGFLFLPESPRWLVMKGRVQDAEQVLERLHGNGNFIIEEIKAIREACEVQERETKLYPNVIAQIFRTPHVRKALLVGCLLQAYQQLAGINTVMYYSASILEMSGLGSHSVVLWVSAGVAATNFVCTITGMYFIDRIGRRPLLLASLIGAILSLVILGVGFVFMGTDVPAVQDVTGMGCGAMKTCRDCVDSALQCGYCFSDSSSSCWARDNVSSLAMAGPCADRTAAHLAWAPSWCPSQYSWIAVFALVLYLFCFAPGMGILPWVINSEIHVTWARGVSTCITTSNNWLFNFITSMVFLSLINALTAAGTFFLFAGIGFTGLLLLWFLLPESKGIPLEEIDTLFKNKISKTFVSKSSRGSKSDEKCAQI